MKGSLGLLCAGNKINGFCKVIKMIEGRFFPSLHKVLSLNCRHLKFLIQVSTHRLNFFDASIFNFKILFLMKKDCVLT